METKRYRNHVSIEEYEGGFLIRGHGNEACIRTTWENAYECVLEFIKNKKI